MTMITNKLFVFTVQKDFILTTKLKDLDCFVNLCNGVEQLYLMILCVFIYNGSLHCTCAKMIKLLILLILCKWSFLLLS